MPETQERIILGDPSTPSYRSEPHIARYRYAKKWIADGMTVLDMGCGTGYGAHDLEEAGAHRVLGVDYSSEAAGYARAHFGSVVTQFAVGHASHVPLAAAAFDAIICMEAIEHFPDIDLSLSEMSRTLKPGGLFLVSTPNKLFHSPHTYEPDNPFHVIEFTLAGFREQLERDFTVEQMLGQQPQDAARTAAQRLTVPSWLKRLLLSVPAMQSYFRAGAHNFVEEGVEGCRFFFAVCRKRA